MQFDDAPPRIGISRCLLGDAVRYNGGHKRDPLLVSTLGRFVEWVPVCPEVDVGMGTPREAIHLVAAADGVPSAGRPVRLLGVTSRRDWTLSMSAFAVRRTRELAALDLAGYVLKTGSPSCGLEGVRVHDPDGQAIGHGRGLFAEALLHAAPNLPVEEDERLHDPHRLDHFLERVRAYQRLRTLLAGRWSRGRLVRFHTAHKLQLLSHSRTHYAALGRLVADGARMPRAALAAAYARRFMTALATPATPGRHADVMTHALGHLKRLVDTGDRDALLAAIDGYRRGQVPLDVPIARLRHHARRHAVEYLEGQTYLAARRLGPASVDLLDPAGGEV